MTTQTEDGKPVTTQTEDGKPVTTQTEDGKPVLCSLELRLKERVQILSRPRESIASVNRLRNRSVTVYLFYVLYVFYTLNEVNEMFFILILKFWIFLLFPTNSKSIRSTQVIALLLFTRFHSLRFYGTIFFFRKLRIR